MDDLRVAVIDRDSGFLRVLSNRAESANWQLRILAAPPRPEELVAMRLNALIVDLALLGRDAWEYVEAVSDALPHLGLVACTGESTVAQRVRGLRLGADDWITKPAHADEVIARVNAVARRRRRSAVRSHDEPIAGGGLEIRADQFQAFADGRSADLTRREFELLHLLAAARGQVLEREEIYQRVWGYAMARGDRSVDVFVRKLRLKLERCSPDWRYLHTHFGVGYRFEPEPRGDVGALDPEPAADDAPAAESDVPRGAGLPI